MFPSKSSRLLACLALLCADAGTSLAQSVFPPAAVTVDGISAISVPVDDGPGGLIVPVPEAVLNIREGTAAIRMNIAGFPSNGIVLDFGGGNAGRMMISESYAVDSRQGHFRLVVMNGSGKQTLEGPVGDARQSYTLAFTWGGGGAAFWVNGKRIGTIQGKSPWTLAPDRLALVEPIGVHWEKVEIWATPLPDKELESLPSEDRWTIDSRTAFLAQRGEKKQGAQVGLLGPGSTSLDKAVKELQMPLPKRELFVDSTKGSDESDGSTFHPFKTIAHAAKIAGPGETVTVMPGTYRESVTLMRSGRKGNPIVFRASPEGPVILNGTDPLAGLAQCTAIPGASLWIKTGFDSRDVLFGDAAYRERLTKLGPNGIRQMERRGRVDTCWLDGHLLPKAESRETLRPYSFWVDKDRHELVLALDPDDHPENHRLEIGARGAFFSGDVSYIVLRGFRALNAGTSNLTGAITLGVSSSNWTIENIDESGGNWSGIMLRGWGHVLRHNVADYNGDEGIAGTLCQYILMESNAWRFNNWQRGINPGWEAAGSKFTQVEHMLVRNQEAGSNVGAGIWFDLNNSNVTVEGGRFYNNGVGIFAEISPGPFVFRNNVCFANSGAGITIGESENFLIENNTLVGNKSGIDLRNIRGRAGPGIVEPGETWKVANGTIRRNIIAQNLTAGIINTFALIDLIQNKVTSDYNVFFRNGAMMVWPLAAGAAANAKLDASNDWTVEENGSGTKLLSFDAIHKTLGLEAHSINVDPKFRNPEVNEYEVDPASPAVALKAGADFPVGTEP